MLSLKSFFLLLIANIVLVNANDLGPRAGCLSDANATFLTNIMVSFSVSFKPKYASQFLAEDFIVQSDSLNFFFGLPSGAITANRTEFIAASLNATESKPPPPPIKVLNVFHTCSTITFRWQSENKPYGPRGIDLMIIKPGTMLIEKDFSEFNNAVDLVLLGLFPCNSTA